MSKRRRTEREIRVKLSPQAYALRYNDVVDRDGEKCAICGNPPPLELDEINGRVNDHRLLNQRLLCKRCNVKEEWRRRRGMAESAVRERVAAKENMAARLGVAVDSPRGDMSYESSVNLAKEPAFRQWVLGILVVEENHSWDDFRDSGAEMFGISTVTSER